MEDENLSLQELMESGDSALSKEQVGILNDNITLTESNLSEDIKTLGDYLSSINTSLSANLKQFTTVLGADELNTYSYSTTVLTRIVSMELNRYNAGADIAGMGNEEWIFDWKQQ